MAVRQGSHLIAENGRVNYVWAGLLQSSSDTGSIAGTSADFGPYTFQVTGTFGAGGSVALQGSNDGINFFAMEDENNTTIAATTNKIWRLSMLPQYIRPAVTAGDGTTNVTAYVSGARLS